MHKWEDQFAIDLKSLFIQNLDQILEKLQLIYIDFLHIFPTTLMFHLEFQSFKAYKQKYHKTFLPPIWYEFIKKMFLIGPFKSP